MPGSKVLHTALRATAIVLLIGRVQATPRQTLVNHVPQAVRGSRRLGPLSTGASLNLAVGLPVRGARELESFVAQVADPASPNYRVY